MPEGPEVFILAKALRRAGLPDAVSRGKKLVTGGMVYSFGLAGKVNLAAGVLTRVPHPFLFSGGVDEDRGDAGDAGGFLDWVTMTLEQVQAHVDRWQGSRKQLGALLLDQAEIAGIGVAWGSEILHAAGGLLPNVSAKTQDLSKLAGVIIAVRDEAVTSYEHLLNETPDPVAFVNGWFDNLYHHRVMTTYKKASAYSANGRTWYVHS